MSSAVTVLVPLAGPSAELPSTLETVEHYLQNTGFSFSLRVLDSRDGEGWGAMLRHAVSEARDSIIVVIDPELPYPVRAIGDALAMIDSGVTDIVFAAAPRSESKHWLIRKLLVDLIPDAAVPLRAYSWDAARLLFSESKLAGGGCDLELAYLANKYGFRLERLEVDASRSRPRFDAWSGLRAVLSIRLTDRRNGYRAARRCPICFSSEVWTWAQIPGNIIRACSRCKCRYLNQFAEEHEGAPVRRVLRAHPVADAIDETLDEPAHSPTAREKTSLRRLRKLRKHVPSRARLLEVGVRDASFGTAAAREYEYVGIDRATATARAARSRGLDVYCSNLTNFVNTGPAFDAVALFHVFENMADPHDALGRVKDLLKPGGTLLLTTFDTEGLLYLLTERRRIAHSFRTHLILYSRSALIELLEHSGFEIVSVTPDLEYRDHKFLRHRLNARSALVGAPLRALLTILPDPLLVSSGSIRIVARRRGGARVDLRAIRSIEPTHAR